MQTFTNKCSHLAKRTNVQSCAEHGVTVLKGKDVTGRVKGEENGWIVCISEDE